jgi:2-oxoglutarate dehydrogenase E1 component
MYLILISHQLIIFFSKSLLRHPKARSDLQEMVGDTNFQRYLPETHDSALVAPEEIKRHVLWIHSHL